MARGTVAGSACSPKPSPVNTRPPRARSERRHRETSRAAKGCSRTIITPLTAIIAPYCAVPSPWAIRSRASAALHWKKMQRHQEVGHPEGQEDPVLEGDGRGQQRARGAELRERLGDLEPDDAAVEEGGDRIRHEEEQEAALGHEASQRHGDGEAHVHHPVQQAEGAGPVIGGHHVRDGRGDRGPVQVSQEPGGEGGDAEPQGCSAEAQKSIPPEASHSPSTSAMRRPNRSASIPPASADSTEPAPYIEPTKPACTSEKPRSRVR